MPAAGGPVIEVIRDVTVGSLRLRTTEWSTTDEPEETVIALHGAFSTRESFARVGHLLAPHFRFIAVDLPGFGESEKPAPIKYDYGAPAFAEAILDLFGGLGLGRAHLLGHCLGGAVAVHLAARRPEVVRGLALIAPLVAIQGPRPLGWFSSPIVGGLLLRQLMGQTMFERFYRRRIRSSIDAEELSRHYELFSEPAARLALLSTLQSARDPRPFIAEVRRLRVPSLLVWGRDDQLCRVEQGRTLSREMPNAGLSLLDGGHCPHEESPTEVANILRQFFRGERAGSSRAAMPK